MRKYFVLEFKLPGGIPLYFTDDFGVFALTVDVTACVQWDSGEEAVDYFNAVKVSADKSFAPLFQHMKVVPFGFN